MKTIKLSRNEWQIDQDLQLGEEGGFGAVFSGYGTDGREVAIKRLHDVNPDIAKREMSMVDEFIGKKFTNVLEFLDSGLDEETKNYYIVMPKAEHDLQSVVDAKNILTENETINIMTQIANGLSEINNLIHRDLKPSNILFHDGNWKIADFGISRFVEATTSNHTLRDFMTYPYAAPEQWLGERTTKATDIYSLGIIAYQLLSGELPFIGPTYEEFRDQHLRQNPPQISGVSPRLNSLIIMMLIKVAGARPVTSRVIEILKDMSSATTAYDFSQSPGLMGLSKASVTEAEKISKQQAEIAVAQKKADDRSKLAISAIDILNGVIDTFFHQIRSVAPLAQFHNPQFKVSIGNATLLVERFEPTVIAEGAFRKSKWDVITGAFISVEQSTPQKYLWSSSLWYTDLGKAEGHRWWEVSYMEGIGASGEPKEYAIYQPFHLKDLARADRAASPGIYVIQLAAKPKPIDGESIQEFINRWSSILEKAYRGELKRPPTLPMD